MWSWTDWMTSRMKMSRTKYCYGLKKHSNVQVEIITTKEKKRVHTWFTDIDSLNLVPINLNFSFVNFVISRIFPSQEKKNRENSDVYELKQKNILGEIIQIPILEVRLNYLSHPNSWTKNSRQYMNHHNHTLCFSHINSAQSECAGYIRLPMCTIK